MIEMLTKEEADKLSTDDFLNALKKKAIKKPVSYTYPNNSTIVIGSETFHPCGTRHFIKAAEYCRLCGISGITRCTEQANCLNISLEEELKAKKKYGR